MCKLTTPCSSCRSWVRFMPSYLSAPRIAVPSVPKRVAALRFVLAHIFSVCSAFTGRPPHNGLLAPQLWNFDGLLRFNFGPGINFNPIYSDVYLFIQAPSAWTVQYFLTTNNASHFVHQFIARTQGLAVFNFTMTSAGLMLGSVRKCCFSPFRADYPIISCLTFISACPV